ncbi:MAG: PTS sugar transporter subunit IIC [Erysipelotrichaceae bacterium]|nr:PTS sugar transporter subunit IIC [Erysipelotrichaceae bacterium]
MKKIIDWMTNVVGPKASAIARNPWIASIQETMVATVPVMIISSFITIISILNEYIPNFPDFSYFSTYTMGLSALMVAYLVPTFVLEKLRLPKYKRQAGFMGAALLLAMSQAFVSEEGYFSVASDRVGASGMFVAIVAGLFVAFIMKLFSKRSLFKKDTKMPKFLVDSFDSMAPIMVIMICAYVTCGLLHLDLYEIVNVMVSPLINIAQSLFGFVLINFLMAFFYSFGLSPWLLTPVYYIVGMDAIAKNAAAVAAGGKATLVLTNETLGGWIWLGGTGCTLMLCILFMLCKSEKLKGLGRTCILPGIFNINEPIVFGSVVFNPLLMIPFWICPIVVSIITYVVMKAGMVTIPSTSFLLWYMPIPIQTYLTNYDFRGVILVLILLAITAVIYYPFVVAYDKQCLEEEAAETK